MIVKKYKFPNSTILFLIIKKNTVFLDCSMSQYPPSFNRRERQ